MKAKFVPENPKDLIYTLSITMPLEDWELLSSQMMSAWPSGDICNQIQSMTIQASKNFTPKETEL